MNYYVDFEATQFAGEIISIGCIREDGETFYSLVAPVKSKITPFITNLTGITKEMLETALDPTTVFNSFYDWVWKDNDLPTFYAWGSTDVDFIRRTFYRTNSKQARAILGYMSGGIKDLSDKFCKSIKVDGCALVKAYNNIFNTDYTQTHNSLDDAVMLWDVANQMRALSTEELRLKMHDFIKERNKNSYNNRESVKVDNGEVKVLKNLSDCDLPVGTVCITKKGKLFKQFVSFTEAAAWTLENIFTEKGRKDVALESIERGIKKACNQQKLYCSIRWVLIREKK
ncbi:MAG: exonuclease domain-containing protein [bacterium]|nr:exonuclease domain-containing protein [bacterium]